MNISGTFKVILQHSNGIFFVAALLQLLNECKYNISICTTIVFTHLSLENFEGLVE